MGGGGLYWYFCKQRHINGIQKCLEAFHRRCIDYLGRLFIPKWDSTSDESVLTTAV